MCGGGGDKEAPSLLGQIVKHVLSLEALNSIYALTFGNVEYWQKYLAETYSVLSPQERSVIAKAARERELAERQGYSDELRCVLICRSLLHIY